MRILRQSKFFEAERFISLLHVESFDYTEWRSENLFRNMTVEELSNAAMEYRRSKKAVHQSIATEYEKADASL